jgi:hypothetical protein
MMSDRLRGGSAPAGRPAPAGGDLGLNAMKRIYNSALGGPETPMRYDPQPDGTMKPVYASQPQGQDDLGFLAFFQNLFGGQGNAQATPPSPTATPRPNPSVMEQMWNIARPPR